MHLPIEEYTSTEMPEAPEEEKALPTTKLFTIGENEALAPQKTIEKIKGTNNTPGVNVPRRKGQILEKTVYEFLGIVWMSPNPNRAMRRA